MSHVLFENRFPPIEPNSRLCFSDMLQRAKRPPFALLCSTSLTDSPRGSYACRAGALILPSTDMKRLLAKIADAANEAASDETGARTPALVFVIACQLFAILILLLRAPGAPLLTVEDMNLMPLWGP